MERADEREKSVGEMSQDAGAHGWALGLVTVLGRIVTDPSRNKESEDWVYSFVCDHIGENSTVPPALS